MAAFLLRCRHRDWVRRIATCVLCSTLFAIPTSAQLTAPRTRNVVVVMTDGLRQQEVFSGADTTLIERAERHSGNLNSESMAERIATAKQKYRRGTTLARRAALMPFLWSTIATHGQIYGNRSRGSEVVTTNGLNISYPGYNEVLTGAPDPSITSNDKNPNPNVTVFEWLARKPEFEGKVAAFGAWDAFSSIFNAGRCGFVVNSGYDQFTQMRENAAIAALNQLKSDAPRVWEDEPFDAIPFYTAMEFLKERKPRLLFIGLGETDDWAHSNDYPEYLNAAHRADQFLRLLWNRLQSMPEYRDSTTLIFTTDHGRGAGLNWTSHGKEISGSGDLWFAVLGPDTPSLGERASIPEIQQSQFASTIAALLGENFNAAAPRAGRAIDEVLGSQRSLLSYLPQHSTSQK